MNDLVKLYPLAIASQCKNVLEVVLDEKYETKLLEKTIKAACGSTLEEHFSVEKPFHPHVCFQLVVEKNYFQPFNSNFKEGFQLNGCFNKLMILWNEMKLDTDRISLWVYDDETKGKRKAESGTRKHWLVPGGFMRLDTVKGLIQDEELIRDDTCKYEKIAVDEGCRQKVIKRANTC